MPEQVADLFARWRAAERAGLTDEAARLAHEGAVLLCEIADALADAVGDMLRTQREMGDAP
jgi:hypothetical protein